MNSSLRIVCIATAARITPGTNGAAVNVSGYSGRARLVLNSSAGEGASHTSTTKVQDSADGTTDWQDTGVAFAQVTNSGASHQVLDVDIDRFRKFIRTVDTLGGTTPAFTRAVELVAKAERG